MENVVANLQAVVGSAQVHAVSQRGACGQIVVQRNGVVEELSRVQTKRIQTCLKTCIVVDVVDGVVANHHRLVGTTRNTAHVERIGRRRRCWEVAFWTVNAVAVYAGTYLAAEEIHAVEGGYRSGAGGPGDPVVFH